MGRKRRIWIPESFYHIVCRGNRRDPLFMDEGDYTTFLYILHQVNEIAPFELASYCLMTNHFHLQLRSREQHISKVMSLINKRYADYYNTKNKLTGHVFEKRYFDEVIHTKESMLAVSRYIHLNPVEAKMTTRPEHYPWSSYRYLLTGSGPVSRIFNMHILLDYFAGGKRDRRKMYKDYVMSKTSRPT